MTSKTSSLKQESLSYHQKTNWTPWLVCLSSALFFFYVILQLTVFSTINTALMYTFSINTSTLSKLSATYLYAASLFYLPAGLLFDRLSTRKVLITASLVCTIGTALIASTSYLPLAFVGRLLTGITNPFAFLGPIRLISRWIPYNRTALAVGLLVAIGMLGGIISQTPFALLIQVINWRTAMLINTFLGILITVVIIFFVKDSPQTVVTEKQTIDTKQLNFSQKLKQACLQRQNWLCASYAGLMNLPLVLIGALWGVLYLAQAKGFSVVSAGNLISFIFIGIMIGSPLIGAISDKIGSRKLPMFISACFAFLTAACIIYSSAPFIILALLFFLLGLLSGAQTMSYPLVLENNPHEIESISLAFVSFLVNVIAAASQNLSGWLINWKKDSRLVHGVMVYSKHDFKLALLVMLIGFLFCILISALVRESNNTKQESQK